MISIVIPTYNVEKFISVAINSVLAQTYKDWELIIVDDCSTDNTVEIVEQFAKDNERIRIIRRTHNSGGARRPRFDGILSAQGEYVTHIDSDDYIEKEYLEKMLKREIVTNSTIVLSKLIYCSESGVVDERQIPEKDFEFSRVLSGREACLMTLGNWKINLAGLLIKTEIYQDYINKVYEDECNSCFNDELDYRKLLTSVKSVAFADANYYYRQQPYSVVHLESSQYIDRINQIIPLYNFIETSYSDNKTAIKMIQSEFIDNVYIAQSTFNLLREKLNIEEKQKNSLKLKAAYKFMKIHKFSGITVKQKMILISYSFMLFIILLRNIYICLKTGKTL